MVKIIILFCNKDRRIINLDMNPNKGGKPAKDKIKDIIIKLLEFFCESINKWSPEVCLSIFTKGIEIII